MHRVAYLAALGGFRVDQGALVGGARLVEFGYWGYVGEDVCVAWVEGGTGGDQFAQQGLVEWGVVIGRDGWLRW